MGSLAAFCGELSRTLTARGQSSNRSLAHVPSFARNAFASERRGREGSAGKLRHANSRIMLDLYWQGLVPTKRQARRRVAKILIGPKWPHAGQRLLLQVLESE